VLKITAVVRAAMAIPAAPMLTSNSMTEKPPERDPERDKTRLTRLEAGE
jgi:hypothetical protein